MFAVPETVATFTPLGTTKTTTVLTLGFMSKAAAARVKDALEGKTYMNFKVTAAVCPGGPLVSIATDYEESPVEILAFAFNCLADPS
jgi:hypothetical protein